MEEQKYNIDRISIMITDIDADMWNKCEAADFELLIELHDRTEDRTYTYYVGVDCDYKDDWRIHTICSVDGKAGDYPPFHSMEERIEKMIRLFLGDFMVHFDRLCQE